MTKEELAEKHATIFINLNYNEPDNYGTEKEIGYHAYYCGFLAALALSENDTNAQLEELKKENVAFKETLEFQQSCTMDRYFKLKKAKKMIRNLLYVYQLGKNELATARVMAEAEDFLKEIEG